MHRNDGGIVDAELLRPRWWIAHHKIIAGKLLPMNIEELQVEGSALVTSIDDCPEIAGGEGSIVTATFKTREVNTIARAEIIGPDGTIETISGTPIHPIWSIDRNDWVPLGELTEGETLQAADGIATVLSLALVTCSLPVYNIEVHGEHVYQVGELGLLVHNTCQLPILNPGFTPLPGIGTKAILPFEKMMRPVAGAWPAVMKNGDVYVHYMHVAANQVANGGMVGAVARSGWAWLDDMGNVVKVMWQ